MLTGTLLQIQPNLDLEKLRFRPESVSEVNLIIPFILLSVILVGAGILTYLYVRRKYRLEEVNRLREETRIRLMISEFNLSVEDIGFFQTVTGSQSPGRYLPLLEFKPQFEEAVGEFRRQQPNHPVLALAPILRQKLGYGFGNMRNAFNDTRMLPIGSRLQCQIAQATKDIVFLSNIVGSSEHQFFIRPPAAGGRPVSIARFPTITLKISREGDAEYEIVAKVAGETPNQMKAVILEHTNDIQKLLFRNAPRSQVALQGKFYLVKQQQAADRAHTRFKAADSQYSFLGNIKDLSIGGALVVIPVTEFKPEVADWVIFQIPEAQIYEDMVAAVVRMTPLDPGTVQLHLRFTGIKELNRLKMNKYLQSLGKPDPRQAAGA